MLRRTRFRAAVSSPAMYAPVPPARSARVHRRGSKRAASAYRNAARFRFFRAAAAGYRAPRVPAHWSDRSSPRSAGAPTPHRTRRRPAQNQGCARDLPATARGRTPPLAALHATRSGPTSPAVGARPRRALRSSSLCVASSRGALRRHRPAGLARSRSCRCSSRHRIAEHHAFRDAVAAVGRNPHRHPIALRRAHDPIAHVIDRGVGRGRRRRQTARVDDRRAALLHGRHEFAVAPGHVAHELRGGLAVDLDVGDVRILRRRVVAPERRLSSRSKPCAPCFCATCATVRL